MDRLTRKELKSDRFALEVQHSVEYVTEHRKQVMRWAGAGAAVVLILVAFFVYRSYERNVRQEKLAAAMQIMNATIGPSQSDYAVTFPTTAERDKAANKAFTELATKYSGTDEGALAEFYLGTTAADAGNIDEAAKRYKIVVDEGSAPYASMAKLSLAQIYAAQGKQSEAEKLIQSVIDHPTELVSKESATIALAKLVAVKDPARARKMLEPLRGSPRSGVSRGALNALDDLSQKN
ncbi:MAG TPA: tetratricopeptide repeat protein [Bryobacteraceae bacterium]|nr:tetratricopeptide repeat protein [Bryobacteraceae bacterium]